MLNDFEKERLRLKINWEGGLFPHYIDYGVSKALYNIFENDFDTLYKYLEKKRLSKNDRKKILEIENRIMTYLEPVDEESLKDIDLNPYNYILEVD